MQTFEKSPEGVPHAVQRSKPDEAAVRTALEIISRSQPFRTSKQCQNLLGYIVEHSLHNDDGSLRERILGVEVFGRSPDYDTSDDPVVRMRAADVRKRLAQFYQSHEHDSGIVHIALKPGSYRATFHYEHDGKKEEHSSEIAPAVAADAVESADRLNAFITPDPIASSMNSTDRHAGRRLGIALASILLAIGFSVIGWRAWTSHQVTSQQQFWAPLVRSDQPVLLYLGANVAYRFTADYMTRYQKEHGLKQNGPEFFVDLPKGGVIAADDLVPVKDTFVSVQDLGASVQVVSQLHRWGKPFNLRSAGDISMGDIRNTPSILVGGFNNPWTLETTNDLPYFFKDGTRIQSRNDPRQSWIVPSTLDNATEDFALISRLLHSNTGGPVLSIGGVGSYGTLAAAEFVSNPDKMKDLLKSAPPGWENENMQAVLRIKVVGYAPVAVDVVATSYW